MTRQGIALVLSAPSGAGKTTLVKRLQQEFPGFAYSVSCTTRPPRAGEVDGKDYHFLQRAEFERRRAAKQFAEWAEVHGNLYGTPLDPVKQTLRQGTDLLFDIDVAGRRPTQAQPRRGRLCLHPAARSGRVGTPPARTGAGR